MRSNRHSIARAAVLLVLSLPALRAATNSASPPSSSLIIRSWGTEAGLPQNTVTAIAQTPDGYLWLGTRDGLARFDGVRFKTFGLEHGLPSVAISSLLADRKGVLWIGTSGSGLCRRSQGQIEVLSDDTQQPGSDTITCLQEDASGTLWIGTRGGLRLCRDGKHMEQAPFTKLASTPIVSLLRSPDAETMWVGPLTSSLQEIRNGRLEPCTGPAGHEQIIAESLLADKRGRLWAGIGNGVVLCREKDQWRTYNESDGLPFAFITSMAEDAEGNVWAGSLDDGLYRFDGSRFTVLRQSDGLSAEDISSLYCDQGGELWIGTRTGGLDRLSRQKLTVIGRAQGLTNDYTHSVAQTRDGTLWVGTLGGSVYRGDLRGFQPFRPVPIVYFYAAVYPVLAMPDGGVWWGGGALLHWQDGRLADCVTNQSWLKNSLVTALQDDRRGGLWIGTSAGNLAHLQNGSFKEFPKQITRAAITSLAVQTNGALWAGTFASGLKLVHEEDGTFVSFTNGLSGNTSIRTLQLDDEGTLWIGTAGEGLSCCRNGRAVSFNPAQGLTPRTVSQIVEDDFGCLWLGCSRGIYKVKKGDLLDCADSRLGFVHARSFGLEDGMPAEECTGGFCPAGLKTRSGLICISTVKGLVFLDPNDLRSEQPPPETLLEEVLINGSPQPLNIQAGSPNRLIIAPGGQDIELHYTATEFATPEKLGFRYQLEGLDKGWTPAGQRRTAYYQRVPPGDYTFRVQACNAEGSWSANATSLAVTALPFLWETAWFRAATVLAFSAVLAGGLGLWLRQRYRQRLARLQMLNAIDRERLRISKDMHDHVGSVLTQVSQLTDMGLNETGDQSLVKSRFERIGDRARVAVQSLDEIVWATNPRNDNLASFAEYVSRFGDEFFEHTNIRCWQDMPSVLPALPLSAEVRHNVFLAAREALNNALKHSQCTEVWLRMNIGETEITLEIQDNGTGFDPGRIPPGGNGLGNMQARLAECGGQTVWESVPKKGTRVRFTFPLRSQSAAQRG